MKIEKNRMFSKLVLISPNSDAQSSAEKYSHFVKFSPWLPYRVARCLDLGISRFGQQNYI